MKLPRGFGKNYFSLSAITATVNQITLHKEVSRVQDFHTKLSSEEDAIEELEEDDLALCQTQQLSSKACHCNCFFRALTSKTLKLFTVMKIYHDYYISLNTTTSPPIRIFYMIEIK